MATKELGSLEDNKQFWKNLFEESDLTSQLMGKDGATPIDEFIFNITLYGQVHLKVKPAVPIGTNFLSDVFIASASLENGKNYRGFVKVLPSHQSRVAASFIGRYYHREAAIYNEWIPELLKLRKSLNLSNSDIPLNVADAYYVNLVLSKDGENFDNGTVYVLEDLKTKGFRMCSMASTPDGIDYPHAKLTMESYANYHALSIAYFRQLRKSDGQYNLSQSCEVFQKDPNYIHPAGVYRTIVLPSYAKILRHLKKDEAADWLMNVLIPQLDDIWNWEASLNSGPLTCVMHGDSWSNNILFRYENEGSTEPLEMLMVDWQLSRCGHPTLDPGYFLFMSTSSAFRRKYLDQLWIEYFATLKTGLKKLNIDLDQENYSQEQFMKETKQRYIMMLFQSLFLLPILLDASKAADHSLKDAEASTVSEETVAEVSQEEKLDEEGTKDGWGELFELKTVVDNSLLSKRVVELLLDVKDFTQNI